jgi:hypothetical protein
METFTQPKIVGYRQLSEAEVALMNEGKALAEQCGEYIEKLRLHPSASAPLADAHKIGPSLDQRWISIGATDIQKGWMCVIRGIAQPTTF